MKLPLDVIQPESVQEAVEATLRKFGWIDALVNNAGYAIRGAIEEIPNEQVGQIFDVNVFGVLRTARAVLPHMRQQGSGRIINIGSIVGRPAFPVNGLYAATKFALAALTDALHLEMAAFGIQVILVEPGIINTPFDDTALARSQTIVSNPASPYHGIYRGFGQFAAGQQRQAAEAGEVSKVVEKALEAARPKRRYLAAVRFSRRLSMGLADPVWEWVLRQMLNTGT